MNSYRYKRLTVSSPFHKHNGSSAIGSSGATSGGGGGSSSNGHVPTPLSWVAVGETLDKIYHGKVSGYSMDSATAAVDDHFLNFHLYDYYRVMRMRCNYATLWQRLRRPVVFTNNDAIQQLALHICSMIHQKFKVCKPSSGAVDQELYELTHVIFEFHGNPAPVFSPVHSGVEDISRFERARKESNGVGDAIFPASNTFTLTLGQKFLFLLALFVPCGNPNGFYAMFHKYSNRHSASSAYLHWFVMMLHFEDYAKHRNLPLIIADWDLPDRYIRNRWPLDVLSSFEPFFDISAVIQRYKRPSTSSSDMVLSRQESTVVLEPSSISITADHVLLLFMLIPLRLADAEGINHPSDSMTLLRSGLKILINSCITGKNVFESQQKQADGKEPWFLDFDLNQAPFLERWLRTIDVLSTWCAQLKSRIEKQKCSWSDLFAALAPVASDIFLNSFKEILKWLPLIPFSETHVAIPKGCIGDDYAEKIMENAIYRTNEEFKSDKWMMHRFRCESTETVECLLKCKRIPDVGVKRGFADQMKLITGRQAFVVEDSVASRLYKCERAFRDFFSVIQEMRHVDMNSKGEMITSTELSFAPGALGDARLPLYDIFDKTSNTYSSLILMHPWTFFLFTAFNYCNWYGSSQAPSRTWSISTRMQQSLFFLSLLRRDVVRREVLLQRPDAKDPKKIHFRGDSYIPLIHQRYDSRSEIATSFDYLYSMLAVALGWKWQIKPVVTEDVHQNRRIVVHLARLLYRLHGKEYHQITFESRFPIRNSVHMRSDSACMQAITWAIFAMGLPRTGYPENREVRFYLPMRTAILDFYSELIQGPRLVWENWQLPKIEQARQTGVLLSTQMYRTKLLFYPTPEYEDNQYLELSRAQVSQLCRWFECKSDTDGKWRGVLNDEIRASIFWAVYSHLYVRLPCTDKEFTRFCALPTHTPAVAYNERVLSEEGKSIWPESDRFAMPLGELFVEQQNCEDAGYPEDVIPGMQAYTAFFFAMNGCGGHQFPFYLVESAEWKNDTFYRNCLRGALFEKPVGCDSESCIPLLRRSHDVIHPLFDSLKFQESPNLFSKQSIVQQHELIQFINELCKSRAGIDPRHHQQQMLLPGAIESPPLSLMNPNIQSRHGTQSGTRRPISSQTISSSSDSQALKKPAPISIKSAWF